MLSNLIRSDGWKLLAVRIGLFGLFWLSRILNEHYDALNDLNYVHYSHAKPQRKHSTDLSHKAIGCEWLLVHHLIRVDALEEYVELNEVSFDKIQRTESFDYLCLK